MLKLFNFHLDPDAGGQGGGNGTGGQGGSGTGTGGEGGGSTEPVAYTADELAWATDAAVKGRMERINANLKAGEEAVKTRVQVPEKYDLKPSKDSLLGEAHLGEIQAYAKAQGYSQKQAEALMTREVGVIKSFAEGQKAQYEKQVEGWKKTLSEDKEFGGENFAPNAERAKRFAEKFGGKELVEEFDKTNLGSHPLLFKMFARLGKLMEEDKLVKSEGQGGEGHSEKTFGSKLYAKTN